MSNREKQWQTLFSWALKSLQMVTAAMKLKALAPWKKVMTNLDSIWKSRDITLPTKAHLVKALVFLAVMWELDYKGWVPNNWCFRIVVLKNTLESPLDSKEIKPVNPKEINPEYSLEGLMLKLKLQYFGHLIQKEEPTLWKRPWCWERLRVGEKGDDRGWDGWMASSTQWPWIWANSRRQWSTGKPDVWQSMGWQS